MKQDEARKALTKELIRTSYLLSVSLGCGSYGASQGEVSAWKYGLLLNEIVCVLWTKLQDKENSEVSEDIVSLVKKAETIRGDIFFDEDEMSLDDMKIGESEEFMSTKFLLRADKLFDTVDFSVTPEPPVKMSKDEYWEMMKKEHGWE